jgi:hypothetical protein
MKVGPSFVGPPMAASWATSPCQRCCRCVLVSLLVFLQKPRNGIPIMDDVHNTACSHLMGIILKLDPAKRTSGPFICSSTVCSTPNEHAGGQSHEKVLVIASLCNMSVGSPLSVCGVES